MPTPQEVYLQRMTMAAQAHPDAPQALGPLTAAYNAHAAPPGPGAIADPFYLGVLLSLDALTFSPDAWIPEAVPLLNLLAETRWLTPIFNDELTFFHMAASFRARPKKLEELHDILAILATLVPNINGAKGMASILASATQLVGTDLALEPEFVLSRLPVLAQAFRACLGRVGKGYKLSAAGSDWHLRGAAGVFPLRLRRLHICVQAPRPVGGLCLLLPLGVL